MAAKRHVLSESPREELSLVEARRLALAAQGFDRNSGLTPSLQSVASVIDATQLFQIDSVNVLVRAHYMPLFSRLGLYDRGLLEEAAYGKKRTLFEYWAHEASLVPLELHPLLRWRMERASRGVGIYGALARFGREKRRFVDEVLTRVRDEGPKAGGDFVSARPKKSPTGWWGWSDAKRALEWLFWAGKLTTATRRQFERIYDLPERVLPRQVLEMPTPSDHDAHLQLVRRAARALGVGSRRDLIDYFRTAIADTDPCIAELVERGELVSVRVEGVKGPMYRLADARVPHAFSTRALLAPFDPIVWERERTHDLFGFHYRIEIYTPAAARKHGYYVLPFLLDDRLVARVDLKADRQNERLLVQAAHVEPHAPAHTADALAAELRLLAQWLALPRIVVGRKGKFTSALRAAIKAKQR